MFLGRIDLGDTHYPHNIKYESREYSVQFMKKLEKYSIFSE